MVASHETMFKHIYRARLDYTYYKDETFEPVFQPDGENPPENVTRIITTRAVLDVCGSNVFCNFDYEVTQNENIALATLHSQEWAHEIKQLSAKGKRLFNQKACLTSNFNYFDINACTDKHDQDSRIT